MQKLPILSMTGFSKLSFVCNEAGYDLEIYALNSRFMDISISLPYRSLELEHKIRSTISEKAKRGKIKVVIKTASADTEFGRFSLMLKDNYKKLKELSKELDAPTPTMGDAISIASILYSIQTDENLSWECLEPHLKKSIEELQYSRQKEGGRLAEDIKVRLSVIKGMVERLKEVYNRWHTERKTELINRLKEIPQDLAGNLDTVDIVSELLGKGDISEEIVRLKTHTDRMIELLNGDSPAGKKLVFLLQEMHREANTIGSKSSCKELVDTVVDIKVELERIREQAQNIL